ncbi:hypothetical protein ADIARSV_1855 [Arcticibacter svalbardensis MN12-7]|uniref:Glycosyltransferase 2-like domain-containing protein n=1 Tax=Arcticibacter svalbardensis MN12-7 TaxID=1150600 RepID=R9H175_9SPHI|nr:glycosyltransferase [Arcticibacter svalbardensis]EOR94984.1 hypothetical protein ADIARSV_1855 [Arcticibacter svalbardensis MN12-7]
MTYIFSEVTLLITHYNRSSSLERLLKSFQTLNCIFKDVVISDDCSSADHQKYLKKIQKELPFRLITTPMNKGLGNNLNKGQDAVLTPFTLYVQEDFVPTEIFPIHFKDALDIMKERSDFDIIRFYAYSPYPYLKDFGKGYSEMIIKPWYTNSNKIYYYSDHPHLRRSDFFKKVGRYTEGIKGDRTEYRMCISFIQNKGKGLFYNEFKTLFTQENSEAEPSSMSRKSWTTSKNPLIFAIRYAYRQVRYNFDLLFAKY